MFKNVTGQTFALTAVDATTGLGKTGDGGNITFYVNKNGAGANATSNAVSEIDSVKDPGGYIVTLLTAETNSDYIRMSGKSTTNNVQIIAQNITTVPANFTTFSIDSSGFVTLVATQRPGIRKNTALTNVSVMMTDSTNHAPATGKTVTVTRSIDGAAFAALAVTTVTELAFGLYFFNLAAADLNGDIILLRATATGCDDTVIEIRTAP